MKRTIIFLLFAALVSAQLQPLSPLTATFVENSSGPNVSSTFLNSSGGTISVYNFDGITQNPRWKAYVGNITGALTLQDNNNQSIFDWTLTTISGEIYATRNETIPDWTSVVCANDFNVSQEQDWLNHNHTADDNINNTFDQTTAESFYTGDTLISVDNCKALYPNVNNTVQTDYFVEVLLHDGDAMIYAGLLENNLAGFNNQSYDYQLLLPENGLVGNQPSTAYYFYVELI